MNVHPAHPSLVVVDNARGRYLNRPDTLDVPTDHRLRHEGSRAQVVHGLPVSPVHSNLAGDLHGEREYECATRNRRGTRLVLLYDVYQKPELVCHARAHHIRFHAEKLEGERYRRVEPVDDDRVVGDLWGCLGYWTSSPSTTFMLRTTAAAPVLLSNALEASPSSRLPT